MTERERRYSELKEKAENVGPIFRLITPYATVFFGFLLTIISTMIFTTLSNVDRKFDRFEARVDRNADKITTLDNRLSVAETVLRGRSYRNFNND